MRARSMPTGGAIADDKTDAFRRWEQAIDRMRQSAMAVLSSRRPTRVLIADDNGPFASLLRIALERRGVRADVAVSEIAVRQMLHAVHYDLIVVDGWFEPDDPTPALFISADPAEERKPYVCKGEGADAIADAAMAVLGR